MIRRIERVTNIRRTDITTLTCMNDLYDKRVWLPRIEDWIDFLDFRHSAVQDLSDGGLGIELDLDSSGLVLDHLCERAVGESNNQVVFAANGVNVLGVA